MTIKMHPFGHAEMKHNQNHVLSQNASTVVLFFKN